EALASYDRALKVRPDYADALYNRGNTLHELKRFEEALVSHDRALKVRPDHADALYNRGVTLQELTRLEEALASYDRALKVRPDHADALYNRGVTLGLSRSTAWSVLNPAHKTSGLSASTIIRIWRAPELPRLVRQRLVEYIEEKIEGLYGHT